MRGDDLQQDAMFSYISPEQRVPSDHPLRPIRRMVDEMLKGLSHRFDKLYSSTGRPSVPRTEPRSTTVWLRVSQPLKARVGNGVRNGRSWSVAGARGS